MEPDPYTEELNLMREQILAEHDGDLTRVMQDSIRRQYTLGRDLYGRSKVTGRIEIVFRAPRSPLASEPAAAGSAPSV